MEERTLWYYINLDIKNITDNKTFWETVKSFLLDKVTSTQKITLTENDKILNNNNNTASVLMTLFLNIVRNLKIPDYNKCDPMATFRNPF